MIDEAKVESAVTYLQTSITEAAKVRADRLYLEQFLKSKKALLMGESVSKTHAAQEREALAHPEYMELLKGYRDAIFNDEKIRFARSAAETTIEAWRSQQANIRATKI